MSGKHPIIQSIEQAQMKQNIPSFAPGDTVVVQVKVKEGERERLQAYEGVVIAKKNAGLNSAFTVQVNLPVLKKSWLLVLNKYLANQLKKRPLCRFFCE